MVRGWIAIAVGFGFGLSLGATPALAADEFEYVGVKKCRTCHKKELIGNQVAAWKKTGHAKAFETLASEEALEYAREAGIQGSPQEADECLECHVTAHGVEKSRIKFALHARDGVQCESCHGPGSGYRKKKIMSDRELAVAKGLIEVSEADCVTCHNDKSPAWDPKRYTLPGGGHAGFDYEQAVEKIEHSIPEDVKGRYVELEKKLRAEKKAGGADEEEEE
jgi:hypothetical protein